MGMVAVVVAVLGIMRGAQRRLDAVLGAGVLTLTLFLALLGRQAGGVATSAVILGNVMAGTALLLLVFSLYLRTRPASMPPARLPLWAMAALALGAAYLPLGALVSAHQAAIACPDLACLGGWSDAAWFDPLRALEEQFPAQSAQAVRDAILLSYRATSALLLALAGAVGWRYRHLVPIRRLAFACAAALLVQAGIGLFIGRLPPPLLPMLAHELLGIAALQVLVALLYAAGAGAHGGDATVPAP
jgi:heme A synthase